MKLNIENFFLKNTGIKQTILKNTFWLVVAEAVGGIMRLVLLIYVARILGATEYGKFTFAFSFVSVMVIFADLGITNIITREFSRNKEKEKEFSAILALDIILSAGTLILMALGSFFITSDFSIRKMIWILGSFILITNFFSVFHAFLRSRQKMEYEAGIKIIQTLIISGLSLFVLFRFHSAMSLSYGYFFSNLIALIFLLLFFHFRFQPLKLSWDKNVFKLLKISWPLSLGIMASWIYISISSVILGYFNLIIENGWYNAASKVAFIAVMPATLVVVSFYPALSNFFITSKEKLQKSWNYLMGVMIFLTMPVVIGGIVLAPKIINFFYGSNFAPSIFVFQFLIFVVGLNFINYPYSIILIVSDQQKKNFALIITGMAINIILNILLIPAYKLFGAVIATTISSLITLILTIIVSKYFTLISIFNIKLLKAAFAAGFSSLVMFFVVRLPAVYNLNIFFSVIAGILIYSFILYLLYKYNGNWKKS